MRTLDSAWQQFQDNARASVKVTTSNTHTDVQTQLAGHLGLCEASMQHLLVPGLSFEIPDCYGVLVRWTRKNIQTGASSADLNMLVQAIDFQYQQLVLRSARGLDGSLLLDSMSALGWLARSVLFLAANMTSKANEAGGHTLDAVTRIVVLTGHMRSDLTGLMRDLGIGIR